MKAAAALCALVAGPVAAEVPPADYFTGIYERVGRAAGAEPALLNDLVRIDPAPDGAGLLLRVCVPEGAPGSAPLVLQFDRFGDVENLLQGGQGREALFCQFFNDAGNYPILICASESAPGEEAARFTLWAKTEAHPEACGR